MEPFRKILIYAILLLVIGTAILLQPKLNGSHKIVNYLHGLVYDDRLEVICSPELDLTNVKLLFENEMAMLENTNPEIAKRIVARSRFNEVIRMVIFENGEQIVEIPYDYGKQRIVVYYGDEEIGSMGQWRTNDYHVHN